MRPLIAAAFAAMSIAGSGVAVVDAVQAHSGVSKPSLSAMTDGFGRNRGTRPHHPRASCRCN